MSEATIVAGDHDDFMTVRHLVSRGDQVAIGRALAEEAHALSGWRPGPADPVVNRARRTWFRQNWPQHDARLDGVAAAFGIDPDRDDVCLDGFASVADSGCSAVWCPPSASTDGRGRLARNYDFFTASMAELMATFGGGGEPPVSTSDDLPIASRPYVLSTFPDDGLASTVLTMSGMDGCMEGVNEAGLSVALLIADIEAAGPPDSTAGPQAGLDVTQVPRFLLDTCENSAQARQALLVAKQYDHGLPCHFVVADALGDGFVFERGAGGTEHFVGLVGAGPLCVTNHPLHIHTDVDRLPADSAETMRTYERARTLTKRTAAEPQSGDDLRAALDDVAMEVAPDAPWRTLWRTVIDPAARSMTVRFYLGDGPGDTARYTPELTFEVTR